METILWLLAIVGAFLIGRYWLPQSVKKLNECEHEWGRWKNWAITWEKRKCNKCGQSELREF